MRKMKVLAIGNSFSVDGMEYLYDIANDYGIEEIILGNLYIGGCSIEMHIEQYEKGLRDYQYYKNTHGTWEVTNDVNLVHGLLDEAWDIITLQQVSHDAGRKEKYDEQLNKLIQIVLSKMTNKQAKLGWHMTWAYQGDSDHGGFRFYDHHQLKMYESITKCVQEEIKTNPVFSYVIPSGTVIQNMRGVLGDCLTRDGFHLSFDKGRFFASLCWFKTLTNLDIDRIKFRPNHVTKEELELSKKAVNAAFKEPFKITDIEREN